MTKKKERGHIYHKIDTADLAFVKSNYKSKKLK